MKIEIKKISDAIGSLKSKADKHKWTDPNNGTEIMFSIEGLEHYVLDVQDAIDRDEAIRMISE